jgi:hypothetical protein
VSAHVLKRRASEFLVPEVRRIHHLLVHGRFRWEVRD